MPPPDPVPTNAGHAFALVLVDELVRHGVTDVVVAPGSRSTPVALALASDERVRLHVRIDERSAAFLALGLARGSGRPVPVLCTSGTAAAHFHAAVLEADQSRVPLLVLTADRPPELRGIGANQTIDQIGLYGGAVRWACDVGVPEARADAVRYWRSLVSRAVGVSTGSAGTPAGPVQLNLPLREPLVPVDDGVGFPHPLEGRGDGAPWTRAVRGGTAVPAELAAAVRRARRGVVVAGDGLSAADVEGVAAFAARAGWPVLAEPHSNLRRPQVAVAGSEALLQSGSFLHAHRADLVLVLGRAGLTRSMTGWLARVPHQVVDRDGSWWDVTRTAAAVHRCDPSALSDLDASTEPGWCDAWMTAGDRAAAAIDALLDEQQVLTEPQVARDLAAALPPGAALVVASSMPIRDLDLTMRPRQALRVVANRGVSGIDGFVSTATGVALTHPGPTWALTGDLSLLHDSNGLVAEGRPDLSIVVVNNDGGGIFSLLPQASSTEARLFDRLFGTPHGVDLAALAAAYGVPHALLRTGDDLAAAVRQPPAGLRLFEVRTDRAANAELHRRLRELFG
ncbi:MAG TPA: 2-succinyl-5-enolpyruvyl-6-hydroxy-3-cyclohexene-1-carboxylic-acid synthase [Mycobacteriales bacterium]|nr:2-succinyl-5-enolpyruvyl-6-hydroxy-3-cyclohexene-1-carboxylic-acid synthase [Mycobacteriales bacterium]